ncbi:MAG: hypothetical protein ACO3L6_03380 [Dehalococcoidia bacterium]|jgi:hypothetical protein
MGNNFALPATAKVISDIIACVPPISMPQRLKRVFVGAAIA